MYNFFIFFRKYKPSLLVKRLSLLDAACTVAVPDLVKRTFCVIC